MDPSSLFGDMLGNPSESASHANGAAGTETPTSTSSPKPDGEGLSKSAKKKRKREKRREAEEKEKKLAKESENGNGIAAATDIEKPSKSSRSPPANGESSSIDTAAPPLKKKKSDTKVVDTVLTDEFTAEAVQEIPATGPVSNSNGKATSDAVQAEATGQIVGESTATAGSESDAMKITHSVRHQVAVPPQYPYVPLSSHVPPAKPAKEYPFTLDPFQRTAISSIQRNESVLVSAHTSAGKTVVAEYAIAQCLKNGQRVVYTSPIKALSNQKYRELAKEFKDVGLMTGDVTINSSASCLVMTTEILRSMLYRGSEIMREVAWVVFDEIHYMRDSERGVVWEETIILLPRKVRYVFLSATIPNAMQFASWIAHTHVQPCHVVYTDFRPTPLQHYLFPAGGDGIHLVVDERGTFREDNFQKAMGSLTAAKGEDPASSEVGKGKSKWQTKKGGQKGPSDIYKVIKMIMVKNYNPVIVFAFSKKECEGLALQMSKLEFNTEEEKTMVSVVFNNAIDALSEEDRGLPQIEHILPLLRRGIGIHHGGLLPILKEIIELLFQEGLIKVLFATETFSIGLNMPAKTVIFTAVRKWDGKEFRNLTSGEFIQMSGRAGRRGLDDRGIVIMMFDEQLEPSAAKVMVKGEADRLDSAFHLGYNMILNLMRVEGISPEYMLERCFFQYQSAASVPELENEVEEATRVFEELIIPDEPTTSDYFNLRKQLNNLSKDFREIISHPNYSLPFLQPGRLVKIKHGDVDFGWGCIVSYQKRAPPKGRPALSMEEMDQNQYIVDCLLQVARGSAVPSMREVVKNAATNNTAAPSGLRRPEPGQESEFVVIPVMLTTVESISGLRLILPKDLRPREARQQVKDRLQEVFRRFPSKDKGASGIPLLDPIKDMKITDEGFRNLLSKIDILEEKLAESPIHTSKELSSLYQAYRAKEDARAHMESLKKQLSDAHSVIQLDELKCRKRVLRRLGFTSSDDVVEKKGRVACEISTGDELLLTEMIFNGVFNDLSEEQCAALLSCFVFNEKVSLGL